MLERPGTPADAIVGVRPARVLVPSTIEEAAALLAAGAGPDEALVFVGGGSERELGAAPERLDTVVATTALDRLIEHAPSDQIVTVEAGMTLAALQRHLAAHRQRLALDPPWPEHATLGGLIAGNAFGPLRSRYGGIRDLLIGLSFVRADGARAKAGGKVVKNVAGFDLPKLLVGSLGTLALITTATFRLHPLPETEETLRFDGLGPAELWALVRRLKLAQLEPTALVALESGAELQLLLRYEGFAAGVAQQRQRTLALACPPPGRCQPLEAATAAALWAAERSVRSDGAVRARLAAPAADFAEVHDAVWRRWSAALGEAQLAWYPLLGVGFLSAPAAPSDATAAAAAIAEARARLVARGGSLVLTAAPAALRRHVDVWGPPPAALALMREVKARFDPQRRLAPGRFVGGL
jgi:glycolate dehydrogenase FAD-binding subunit